MTIKKQKHIKPKSYKDYLSEARQKKQIQATDEEVTAWLGKLKSNHYNSKFNV